MADKLHALLLKIAHASQAHLNALEASRKACCGDKDATLSWEDALKALGAATDKQEKLLKRFNKLKP